MPQIDDVIKLQDRETIFRLANDLTGISADKVDRFDVLIQNVSRRIMAVRCGSLQRYLAYITDHPSELDYLISALGIHTTSWFRELPHYRNLESHLMEKLSRSDGGFKFRLLSAACSSGEELYSFGMVLETFRRRMRGFDYELVGVDVDPLSIQRAESGTYRIDDPGVIPHIYRRFLTGRSSQAGDQLVIDPQIRSRASFHVANLTQPFPAHSGLFDHIVCRNMLIYFSDEIIDRIVRNLLEILSPSGLLTLGHCEVIDGRSFDLACLGNSTYERSSAHTREQGELAGKVLVVDDSPSVRLWLTNLLKNTGLEAITVGSAEEAGDYLLKNGVDLITLDMNLPGQHGLGWLADQRKIGLSVPVIVFTEVSPTEAPNVLDALSGHAQDYVNKSLVGVDGGELIDRIIGLIQAHRSRMERRMERKSESSPRAHLQLRVSRPEAILIGASTGGTNALTHILARLPEDCPPVICVQHIPEEFASAFRDRLAAVSGLRIGNLNKPAPLLPGHLYLPVTDAHVGIRRSGDRLIAYLSNDDRIMGHRPSVDYLFQSAALLKEQRVLACLLTGMGKDGARGLLELRQIGAITLAQDEQSSVVWGMPGEAVRLGAPMAVGGPNELRAWIQLAIRAGRPGAPAKRNVA